MKTKQQTNDLFTFPRLRTKNGRYCTAEQFRRERVDGHNKRLEYERDKYKRAWLAACATIARLEREITTMKNG